MSDETPTPETPEPDVATGATAGAVVTVEPPLVVPSGAAYPTGPVERPTVWSKFIAPLVVPVAVAAGIIFFVLNVSRIFLANDETLAFVFASTITILILGGGTALAASPKLRSSSLTMILGGSLLVLMLGGMISIGAASPDVASGPVQCTPVTIKIATTAGAGGLFKFTPNALTAKAGCVQINVKFDGTHTFQFTAGATAAAFPTLDGNTPSFAAKLPPGEYPFECTIPGHATAGMKGTLTVT